VNIDLYEKHLRALKNNPIPTEPVNGGIPLSTFVALVDGWGERVWQTGTLARKVRERFKP
jgi:hypothetical protein